MSDHSAPHTPVQIISRGIERLNRAVGQAVSWLTLGMVLVMFGLVALRYFFDISWIWVQESITWMHAAVFMLAAAYTLTEDEHVRVDIFYRGFSARGKAIVNLVGTLVFLLPFTGFILWISWEYVALSWSINEGSQEAGGLPYPWVPLMKTFIPFAAVLLVLQGVAILLTSLQTILTTNDGAKA